MKQKLKRNMRFSMWIFILLFVLTMVYLAYSIVTYGEKWYVSTANPRIKHARDISAGGTIFDSKGVILAASNGDERVYSSDRDVRRAMSHVVGDVYGKSVGAETIFARYLYGSDNDISNIISGSAGKGSDITLTIDSKLSEFIYDHMDEHTGSVVVMNYKTGEILASVSIPTFDPETLADEEPQGTSLVDRATMGRYPPGSVMKIVTAAAAAENGIDITYTCKGVDIIEGQRVTCVSEHGEQTLEEAFANSCNCYFAHLANEIGGTTLKAEADKFAFNTEFNFSDVVLYKSNFELSGNRGDLAWAGIGQYTDLVTPMHVCMMAGAIANDGRMMTPKLLRSVGDELVLSPSIYKQVTDSDTAKKIKEYMRKVVSSGTGKSAEISGATMYGKTGTAEYEEDGEVKNHSWFAGFIDSDTKPYAIAVIGEGAGYGSKYAAPLAGEIMEYIVNG